MSNTTSVPTNCEYYIEDILNNVTNESPIFCISENMPFFERYGLGLAHGVIDTAVKHVNLIVMNLSNQPIRI